MSYLQEISPLIATDRGRIFYLDEPSQSETERTSDLEEKLKRIVAQKPSVSDFIVLDRSTEVGWISTKRAATIAEFCSAHDIPISQFVYVSQDRNAPARLAESFAKVGSAPPRWI
ncbi:hypothetical protein [Acuticoccus sediminis]|uniref:hypothetical protein n=1 Tax=Acuticoccus sediminis TaxID=2184697 RepID=UPI0011B93F55|nr:hypothetical protein [Acuticoccus sediminis]